MADLSRRLGLFDATMLVMGGIVGAGIFINPYVVAREVHSAGLILLAWLAGGVIALVGAFIWAELAARRPAAGGQYAYIREAFHPLVAFLYGWVLLLVIQSGGMAAVAMTFAHYAGELVHARLPEAGVAALVLAALTAINCLGVRWGSNVQSALMVTKVAAILALVVFGLAADTATATASAAPAAAAVATDGIGAMGAALVPVLFAYGGWQTTSFIAGELRRPERDLPRGLLLGVVGVVALYLAVNYVCVRVLGPAGLAATRTPASEVMRRAAGDRGATLIAAGIAVSTLGFLSQGILTAPRVYYAMARDGVFLRGVGTLHPRTQVPIVAIVLQGAAATAIALSGRYEQILDYVVSMDFIFFGATAAALIVLRRREPAPASYRVPGHPWTTGAFVAVCLVVVVNTVARHPANTALGIAILMTGVPVYFLWRRRGAETPDR
ncbi:MAG TPA: amino acid permease [Kofleriaceae bacterium]|nr:amino acid permease [Kofleriaceae bacterium]